MVHAGAVDRQAAFATQGIVARQLDEPRGVPGNSARRPLKSYWTATFPRGMPNGTVKPSDMPMTMSRTVSDAVKCFSMCGVCGIRDYLCEERLAEDEG